MLPNRSKRDSVTTHRTWALHPAGAAVIAAWPRHSAALPFAHGLSKQPELTGLGDEGLQLPPPPCSIALKEYCRLGQQCDLTDLSLQILQLLPQLAPLPLGLLAQLLPGLLLAAALSSRPGCLQCGAQLCSLSLQLGMGLPLLLAKAR